MKSFKDYEKEELYEKIQPKINKLVMDYWQQMEDDESDYLIRRIGELMQTFVWADERHFDEAHKEMLRNFPYYKKINVATFMTAFYKANLQRND